MRPTLRQMEYIVAIAETGRFGDAARKLNVSQPSLSAQVADVEEQLGVQLVERGRQGAVLTPLGVEFVSRARIVLGLVRDMKGAMVSDQLSGQLRLGVLPSVGPYLLPDAVKRLHASYPDLRFTVREENTIDLETMLKDGSLDTIICTAEDHPSTHSEPLFQESLWICAAPDDPIAGTGPVSPKDLAGRELLTVGFGHRLGLIVQSLADQFGAHVSNEYKGTSLDATRQMAAMGAGLAVLPSLYAVSEASRDRDLILRPIASPKARREISLIWRKSSPLSQSFRTIAEALRDVAEAKLGAAKD